MTAEKVGAAIGAVIVVSLGLGFIFAMGGSGGCDAVCAAEQQQMVDDRADRATVREWTREAERYSNW